MDALLPRLFTDVLSVIGHYVLSVINGSVSSGVVPKNCKVDV